LVLQRIDGNNRSINAMGYFKVIAACVINAQSLYLQPRPLVAVTPDITL
jgi:hypothetical protein